MKISMGSSKFVGISRHARVSLLAVAAAIGLAGSILPASAQQVVNLYSSRHYDTDDKLYGEFEQKTGIKVNRIEGDASALMKRIQSEGANSPADVLITVDAGRLWAADKDGIFQPIKSEVLEKAIPANLRHPEGNWFGFSKRARVIFYDKARVKDPPKTYEDLANPKYKGLVCTRSGSNIYMLSLMSAVIANNGADKAKEWAKGMWENRAREPEGGDTDQIKAIVSGACGIVLSNTYYFANAMAKKADWLVGKEDTIGVVLPNQETTGTHVNISGGGVVKTAPNKENAIKLLEYLTSPSAQKYFADGNNEYPVAAGVEPSSAVQKLGTFKEDKLDIVKLGINQPQAQKIYDEVGYK